MDYDSSNNTTQAFLEALQNDFKLLSNETKKKYPQIKEVCCTFINYTFIVLMIDFYFSLVMKQLLNLKMQVHLNRLQFIMS